MKKITEKSLTMPKKTEVGPLGFFSIHSVAKYQKLNRDPLGKIFSKKESHNAEKTERGTL